MTVKTDFECDQSGCPLLEDGQCLEGFGVVAECPHSQESVVHAGPVGEELEHPNDTPDIPGVLDGGADPETEPGSPSSTQLGGDEALSLQDAGNLLEKRPCVVVLIAGEFESGKTTLVVELYAQFLGSRFDGWSFAGSKTLKALDDRHRPARLSSGAAEASTERTQDDDMRLLHLRLAQDSRRIDLLVSDVRGEFFENVINGSDVASEVPLAGRADKSVLVLDGELLASSETRSEALVRARQLIGGMTEAGGLRPGSELLILCSKADLLSESQLTNQAPLLSTLAGFCEQRGLRSRVLIVSARPKKSTSSAFGLEDLLSWLTEAPTHPANAGRARASTSGRYFWRSEAQVR